MKIQVQQTGGFAGLTQTLFDADTARLDSKKAARVEHLIADLEAVFLSGGNAAPPVGADLLKFELALTDERGRRTLAITDNGSQSIEPVRRLLGQLSQLTAHDP